ncbi:MAG: hypothetical protein NZ874_10490 [Fimbriimonadales bacterium]|nr:hypothetical protein [Fimbriimonadales bacterium]
MQAGSVVSAGCRHARAGWASSLCSVAWTVLSVPRRRGRRRYGLDKTVQATLGMGETPKPRVTCASVTLASRTPT